MNQKIYDQCIEFLNSIVNEREPFIGSVNIAAQKILDQVCNHQNVSPNQYCHLCGWHNVRTKRSK